MCDLPKHGEATFFRQAPRPSQKAGRSLQGGESDGACASNHPPLAKGGLGGWTVRRHAPKGMVLAQAIIPPLRRGGWGGGQCAATHPEGAVTGVDPALHPEGERRGVCNPSEEPS